MYFVMTVFCMAIMLLISLILFALLFGCAPVIAYIVNWIGDTIFDVVDWIGDIFRN